MREVLPLGYETILYVNGTDEEEIIPEKKIYSDKAVKNKEGQWVYELRMTIPQSVIPKGNFTGFTFIGANGNEYSEHWIYHNVGPKPIREIFDKLEVKILVEND